MAKTLAKAGLKAIMRLEKYPDGVTQEQIDKGEVQPVEVIELEENIIE